ncbi:MAG: glycosyltransferase family 39 protein [Patescibacteria group bacterium]|nr:glycosyltransferase family 39 protein [Patescibacteria group bacterium]
MLKVFNSIFLEIKQNKLAYLFLLLLLIIAFFLRVYRAEDLIGFYYDQGRDALVIWRFWNEGKLFLVGPVTGLAGIFLGPLYYYLIAPFYLLGRGDPIFVAYFLAFISTLALLVVYVLGKEMHSRTAGLFAVLLCAISYYIVLAGRWVSNPTPILLTSVLLLWALWEIAKGNKNSHILWPVVAFLVGASMQFESASGVFYIPIVIIFSLVFKSNFPSPKTFLISFFIFFLTLLPQILFNFRHDNLLFNNFYKVIVEQKSFRLNFWDVLNIRLAYFWDVFQSKLFLGLTKYSHAISLLSFLTLLYFRNSLNKNIFIIFGIFFAVPAFFYILFQGNYGNIYDYYLTGYYLPMILFFAIGLAVLFKSSFMGKLVVSLFFIGFLYQNSILLRNFLNAGVDGPTHITLGNQKQAVNWIYDNAYKNNIKSYNIDVYVPPVIPYAYDYLFLWIGERRCGKSLCGYDKKEKQSVLYVLYEVDPPHPERLENWLLKYQGNTKILEESRFGGIFVQRRERI